MTSARLYELMGLVDKVNTKSEGTITPSAFLQYGLCGWSITIVDKRPDYWSTCYTEHGEAESTEYTDYVYDPDFERAAQHMRKLVAA